MAQMLTLSRAAQLIGVTRGALQKHIREGELPSQEGYVSTEDLLRLYPDLQLEESGAFERVTHIKEQAFGRRVRERLLPSQEILAQRLFVQSEELAEVRRHLSAYHELVVGLRQRIEAAARQTGREDLQELGAFVDDGLAGVLGSEAPTDVLGVMDDMLKVMAARVTVKPSGREFLVEGSETILQAALRAGLAPAYGCGNGNCGLCKARVVEGGVRQVQHSDYPLSAAEKAQNHVLLCSCTAVSDLVVEMLEASSASDIPGQQIVARVKAVAPLDARTMGLHVQTPRNSRLRFLAGQGVTLGVAGGTTDFRGDYLVASCPCDDRNLLFHIPYDEEDEFSVRLFAGAVRAGDTIDVWGPWGDFVLRQDSSRPIACLCCDTGFAPVRSLVEHAMAIDAAEALAVYWAATKDDGHYLANQCRAWSDALDNFRYVPLTAADAAAAGASVAAAFAAGERTADWDVYVAGPPAFGEAAVAALAAAGVAAERIARTIA